MSQKTLPHTNFAVVIDPVCLINITFDCIIQCDDGSVALCVDSCEDLVYDGSVALCGDSCEDLL